MFAVANLPVDSSGKPTAATANKTVVDGTNITSFGFKNQFETNLILILLLSIALF